MERVANMVPDTREGAIQKFLDAASDVGTYVDSDDTANQKVKEVYTSRTMIYKEDPEPVNSSDDAHSKQPKIQPVKSSPFPEEDLIDKTEWNCYGSTQVHYLVLDPVVQKTTVEKRRNKRGKLQPNGPSDVPPEFAEMERTFQDFMKHFIGAGMGRPFPGIKSDLEKDDPSQMTTGKNGTKKNDMPPDNDGQNNKNDDDDHDHDDDNDRFTSTTIVTKIITQPSKGGGKIAAITPENIGLSIRRIDSEVGHFTVADIGSIRICLETASSLLGDDDDENVADSAKNNKANQQRQRELSKAAENSMRPTGIDQSGGDDPEKKKSRTVDLKKFYNFSWKVAEKMQQNVMDVKDAVSDDFPGRTYRFGVKICERMEGTTKSTFSYMSKLFDSARK